MIFLVELHLDDVLEVLLVAGSEIYQITFEDKYQCKIKRKKGNMMLNFDFDLPCRTSHRRCSRGSPGGWS